MSQLLWACHACQMIGSYREAWAHHQQAGHDVEPLSAEESAGVRDIWEREQVRRVTALIAWANLAGAGQIEGDSQ